MKRRGSRLTLVNGLEASLLPVVKGVAELDLRDGARAKVANGRGRGGGLTCCEGGSDDHGGEQSEGCQALEHLVLSLID